MRQRFNEALKTALKSKDQRRVLTIRLILAAIKDRDIAIRGNGDFDGVSDEEIVVILQRMIKQRRESIAYYEAAGRIELAEREEHEIRIITEFLPPQLEGEDLEKAVRAVIEEVEAKGIKDMGRTMAALKSQYAGKLDLTAAAAMVKRILVN